MISSSIRIPPRRGGFSEKADVGRPAQELWQHYGISSANLLQMESEVRGLATSDVSPWRGTYTHVSTDIDQQDYSLPDFPIGSLTDIIQRAPVTVACRSAGVR